MILIITEKFDPHADLVRAELSKRGAICHRLHLSDFPTQMAVSYFAGLCRQPSVIRYEGHELLLSAVRSVWYRRTESFSFPDLLAAEELAIARRECHSFVQGLWKSMVSAKWISRPDKIREASIKAEQLLRADKLGFKIPPTCFSNEPSAIRSFVNAYAPSQHVVYKPHTPIFVPRNDGNVGVAYTTLLDEQNLERLEEISITPGIFQVYVPKRLDIRVTIVGDKIFSCGIDSQSYPETSVDWRAYPWGSEVMPHHGEYDLPHETRDMCLRLVKSYGLEFGAIDLVLGRDDKVYFLELNPNGQWAWVQSLTGMQMKEAFVDLLCSD